VAVEGDKDESGLDCLVLLLRFHGVAVDPAQIGHRFGGGPIKVTEMLRCAKELKLKARAVVVDWPRLAKLSLPAIAECKDGGFLILGKVGEHLAVVLTCPRRPLTEQRRRLGPVGRRKTALQARPSSQLQPSAPYHIQCARKYRFPVSLGAQRPIQ